MSNNFSTKDIVYTGLLVFLIVVAFFALLFSLSDIECTFLHFSATAFREILGVFISAVGLVVTAYLVVMAVSAYGRMREIEETYNDVNTIYKDIITIQTETANTLAAVQQKEREITRNLNQYQKLSEDFTESLYNFNDEQIKIAEENEKIEWKNKLFIKRARMSYNYPLLDSKIRNKLLLELSSIGDKTDIESVGKICADETENPDIREVAKLVLEELKKRNLPR